MTKTRGGRRVLEDLLSDLDYLDDAANLSRDLVLFDPDGAYKRLLKISNLSAQIRKRIHEELDPLLERAARNVAQAALPERVAALEATLAAVKVELAELRAQAEGQGRKITPFRKDV